MVEKGINFIFCLGTAYDISSMESVGMLQVVFIGGMDTPPKMFLSLIFSLSSGTSTNHYFPPRRAFLLLMHFYFEFESPSSLIKHQLRGTMIVFDQWVSLIFERVS